MRARLRVTPAAWADLRNCEAYIRRDNPDAALRLRRAAKRTFEMIAEHPRSAPFHTARDPKAMGLRKMPVIGFRSYIVFYAILGEDEVQVARVLHGSRDIPSVLGFPN